MPDVSQLSGGAVYAVLCVLVFVECALLLGFLLPGDTVLVAGGLLAARRGSGVDLPTLLAAVIASAVAGEAVGYLVGRRLGRPLLLRWASRRGEAHALARTEHLVERYGALALVSARFIPWVRTFAPLVAGAARMPAGIFALANLAGGVCWAGGLVVAGWSAHALPPAGRAILAGVLGTVVLVALAGAVLGRRRRGRSAGPPDGNRAGPA